MEYRLAPSADNMHVLRTVIVEIDHNPEPSKVGTVGTWGY